ncbi:D-3-phosphoglycerate dehydrogenase [Penicillium alfredii]|uniref:D-3-phosphoglycerate dehydrogenase n=1 Tax=Penicillium alfredii TaxID=1506179 RepID=A0A9W9FA19_9EURO|nr:D-3-phosphoglycerate dehydrogenase [Penicillium alfredii]KAJ5096381.1 D-3-phosphoglycerate dehydrogenase [Penicillium alfredii]
MAAPGSANPTLTTTTPTLAILDDYLDIASSHFTHIPKTGARRRAPALHDHLVHARAHPFPADLLRQLPNLKLLLATGTQFESFDLAAARDLGIAVAVAPGAGRSDGRATASASARARLDLTKGGSHPTTQHAWALILALARNVAADDAAIKTAPAPAPWQTRLAKGLAGLTLGVVGLGRLGAAVARIAVLAFGMDVICWSANLTQEKADSTAQELGLPVYGPLDDSGADAQTPTFRVVSKQELFAQADVVTLHYVLGDRSRGLVGVPELAAMKPSALLVNTSRGPLVEEAALYDTLQRGRIAGAALDVFDLEPLPRDSRWRSPDWGTGGRSALVMTPHMGYVDEGLMHTWYEETAENVERWLQGKDLLHRLV